MTARDAFLRCARSGVGVYRYCSPSVEGPISDGGALTWVQLAVLTVGDWLQVFGIYTARILANVVQVDAFRYRAEAILVVPDVRASAHTSAPHASVAERPLGSLPLPTASVRVHDVADAGLAARVAIAVPNGLADDVPDAGIGTFRQWRAFAASTHAEAAQVGSVAGLARLLVRASEVTTAAQSRTVLLGASARRAHGIFGAHFSDLLHRSGDVVPRAFAAPLGVSILPDASEWTLR